MKRLTVPWSAMLVVLLALTLSACAAPGGGGGMAEVEEQREIVWMARTNVVENPWEQEVAIPAFEAANPNITVKSPDRGSGRTLP